MACRSMLNLPRNDQSRSKPVIIKPLASTVLHFVGFRLFLMLSRLPLENKQSCMCRKSTKLRCVCSWRYSAISIALIYDVKRSIQRCQMMSNPGMVKGFVPRKSHIITQCVKTDSAILSVLTTKRRL